MVILSSDILSGLPNLSAHLFLQVSLYRGAQGYHFFQLEGTNPLQLLLSIHRSGDIPNKQRYHRLYSKVTLFTINVYLVRYDVHRNIKSNDHMHH